MFCGQTNCVGQFTGWFCESCLYFDRTPENIKDVRNCKNEVNKRIDREMKAEMERDEFYRKQTDKVWNDYCNEQKKKEEAEKEAKEYAEYLRLKAKYEGN